MPAVKRTKLQTLRSLDEIPAFANEAQEAEFWATHSLGSGILDQMGPVPEDVLPAPRPRTKPIAVRFDADTVNRLKALAQRKRKGYQTLLKEFVIERLYEEEKRAGLISS